MPDIKLLLAINAYSDISVVFLSQSSIIVGFILEATQRCLLTHVAHLATDNIQHFYLYKISIYKLITFNIIVNETDFI